MHCICFVTLSPGEAPAGCCSCPLSVKTTPIIAVIHFPLTYEGQGVGVTLVHFYLPINSFLMHTRRSCNKDVAVMVEQIRRGNGRN